MGQNLGDRARSGQRSPSAFCMSLLHHTTIGTVQSVDFSDGFFFSVSGTCFGNIGKQVLFPYVSVPVSCFRKDFPPSLSFILPRTSFLFFNVTTKKKSCQKKILVILRHSKGMDDDDVQSLHEAVRIVEQRPAQAQHRQHREHHQQWYDTLMDQGASAGVSSAGGGAQSFAEVWTFLVNGFSGRRTRCVWMCVCVCVCACVITYFKCVRLVI